MSKILAILDKTMMKQADQNKSQKQTNNSSVKTLNTKEIEKPSSQPKIALPEQQQDTVLHQTPTVIPAPLKTSFFDKAQFIYNRELPAGNTETSAGSGTLLIKLETLTMGRLWITVAIPNDTLTISFYNNQIDNINLIKESLSDLKEELHSSDFKNIYLKCQVTDDTWLQNNILKNFQQDNISFINFKV